MQGKDQNIEFAELSQKRKSVNPIYIKLTEEILAYFKTKKIKIYVNFRF